MVQPLEVQINYRLLIGTFLASILSGVSVVQLYSQRQTAIVKGLEQRVDESLLDSDYKVAYRDLSVLTKLLPLDAHRKIQLADCADRVADNPNEIKSAMRLSHQVLGICLSDPHLESWVPSIRRRLLKRHAELGEFEEVINLATQLVGSDVDLELQRYYSVAKARLYLLDRDYDLKTPAPEELPDWFASLLSIRPLDLLVATNHEIPEDFEIAALLSDLCLGEPSRLSGSFLAGQSNSSLQQRASEIAEKLTERRQSDPFAWLLRFEVGARMGKPETSVELLEKAIDLAGGDPKVLLVAGRLYLDKAKSFGADNSEELKTEYLARSAKVLEQAKELGADDVDLYVLLGDIAIEKGQPEAAIELWRSGRKSGVGHVSLLDFRIVQTLIQRGELNEAQVIICLPRRV
jgi:tetratricopeptide (TPR) repeat protein